MWYAYNFKWNKIVWQNWEKKIFQMEKKYANDDADLKVDVCLETMHIPRYFVNCFYKPWT